MAPGLSAPGVGRFARGVASRTGLGARLGAASGQELSQPGAYPSGRYPLLSTPAQNTGPGPYPGHQG